MIYILLVCALFISNANAYEPLWWNNFEFPIGAYPWPNTPTGSLMLYHGYCFRKSNGDNFDSWTISDKYAINGKSSIRVFNDNAFPNNKAKNCPYSWLKAENKVRNEIQIGSNGSSSDPNPWWGELRFDDPGLWVVFAMYIPSNEGNYSDWIQMGTPRSIIFQFFGGGNSGTPETHGLLGKNLKLDIEITYSTHPSREENNHKRYNVYLDKDKWNTVVMYKKRSWENDGEFKLWLNCPNLPKQCNPIINYKGPNAIRNKPYQYIKMFNYRSDGGYAKRVQQVFYFDAASLHRQGTPWVNVVGDLYQHSEKSLPMPPTWSMK